MYLLTFKEQGDNTLTSQPFADITAARAAAENAAMQGRCDVTLWVQTHTVEAVQKFNWKDNARGITSARLSATQ